MKLRGVLGGFSDEGLVEGGETARIRERDEQRRQKRLAAASALRRLPVEDLRFGRFGVVEHVPSGDLFFVMRGAEVVDVQFTAAVAVTAGESGDPIFLQPAP